MDCWVFVFWVERRRNAINDSGFRGFETPATSCGRHHDTGREQRRPTCLGHLVWLDWGIPSISLINRIIDAVNSRYRLDDVGAWMALTVV
ncbi:hypothetical protein AAFG13_21600 [Bradyrhizobium sp. B124]|uniref:hypothetical protein n=1 Tax=Bradyrhizobium sp. B124 TaxID=3140245 RepID=UPI00318410A0